MNSLVLIGSMLRSSVSPRVKVIGRWVRSTSNQSINTSCDCTHQRVHGLCILLRGLWPDCVFTAFSAFQVLPLCLPCNQSLGHTLLERIFRIGNSLPEEDLLHQLILHTFLLDPTHCQEPQVCRVAKGRWRDMAEDLEDLWKPMERTDERDFQLFLFIAHHLAGFF